MSGLLMGFLLETIKDSSYLIGVVDGVRLDVQPSLADHGRGKVDVGEYPPGAHLVPDGNAQLVQASVLLHGGQERVTKSLDIALGCVSGFPGHVAQDVHYLGHINGVGAAGRACLAGGAQPNGMATEHGLPLPQLDKSHNPAYRDVIGEVEGTAGGAVAALVAFGHVLSATLLDFLDETGVGLLEVVLHIMSPCC